MRHIFLQRAGTQVPINLPDFHIRPNSSRSKYVQFSKFEISKNFEAYKEKNCHVESHKPYACCHPSRDTVPIKHFIQSVLVPRAKCSLNPDLFGEYPDSVNLTNRTIYDGLLYQYTKY